MQAGAPRSATESSKEGGGGDGKRGGGTVATKRQTPDQAPLFNSPPWTRSTLPSRGSWTLSRVHFRPRPSSTFTKLGMCLSRCGFRVESGRERERERERESKVSPNLLFRSRFVITVASCVTCSAIYTGCAVWGVYVILAHVGPKGGGQGGGGSRGGRGGRGGGGIGGVGLSPGMARRPTVGEDSSSMTASVCSREGMFTLIFRVAASIAGVVGGALLGGFVGIATGVPVSLTIAMMYVDSIKCEFEHLGAQLCFLLSSCLLLSSLLLSYSSTLAPLCSSAPLLLGLRSLFSSSALVLARPFDSPSPLFADYLTMSVAVSLGVSIGLFISYLQLGRGSANLVGTL